MGDLRYKNCVKILHIFEYFASQPSFSFSAGVSFFHFCKFACSHKEMRLAQAHRLEI